MRASLTIRCDANRPAFQVPKPLNDLHEALKRRTRSTYTSVQPRLEECNNYTKEMAESRDTNIERIKSSLKDFIDGECLAITKLIEDATKAIEASDLVDLEVNPAGTDADADTDSDESKFKH